MSYTKRIWSEEHKKLRDLFKREATFNEAIALFMNLHARLHASFPTDYSFEDELWEDLTEEAFKKAQNKKGRTIAYSLWHSARIEDMTMNLLVTQGTQVIDKNNWQKKVGSSIYDTGNALTPKEILKFSSHLNMANLKKYRQAVGKRTREIVSSLSYSDLKRKVYQDGLDKIIDLGAVVKNEEAFWLIDYWKNKTVAGILLMPATRHLLVHINESLDAKRIDGNNKSLIILNKIPKLISEKVR